MLSPALKYATRSLWSYNPIPRGCVLYLPLWHPGLSGPKFNSIDPLRHTCTVTGSTYGPTGRTFGNTDGIQMPAHSIFQWGTAEWSWILWIKKDYTNNEWVLDQGGATDWGIRTNLTAGALMVVFEGEDNIISDNAAHDDDVWTCVGIARDGNDCLFYKNGALHCTEANTLTTGDVTGTDTVTVGNIKTLNTGMDGTVGEVALYNTQLSVVELAYYYNATKGRYA